MPSRASGTFLFRAVALVAGVAVLGAGAFAALFGSGLGGIPVAEAPIQREPSASAGLPAATPGPERRETAIAPGSPRKSADELEAASGVSVVRPAGTVGSGAVFVQVPADISRLAPAPDPSMVETTRHGRLPRIAPDGARAIDVYGRKPGGAVAGANPSRRVAVVVGGLGIGLTVTGDAIEKLPAAVTLAFAPYGQDLERLASRAREAGHEILLQVPMEPFDYPDSDPGPHTLMAAARPAENLDHLHWAMGRFTGYVGVMNYMGAKLTADERALGPILREAGARGLGVLDDGSSSRSLVTALGAETPTARADVVLDAVPRADLIDKALERLEAAATGGKVAVASASALPVTVDRLVRWAAGLEARGFMLVPVSGAFAARPREGARR